MQGSFGLSTNLRRGRLAHPVRSRRSVRLLKHVVQRVQLHVSTLDMSRVEAFN